MSEIKIFEHPEFGQVRTTVSASNESLFCAKDVAERLGYKNSRDAVLKHVDEDDKTTVAICDTNSNYKTNAVFINVSGVYSLILSSKLACAKQFKHWVTSEVLPEIQKNGAYVMAKDEETPEELMARALVAAQEALQRKEQRLKEVEAKNSQQAERIELQSEELKKQAPKVAYHDEVLTSTSTYNTTNIAKEFGMGAPTLNQILHEMGIQYKAGDQWLLYHKYQDKGYTRTVTRTYDNGYGEVHTRQQTVWTERGRQFIHQVMKAELKGA